MPTDTAPRPFAQFDAMARALVELDLELGDQPRHRLAGYVAEEPLAVVDLRPFPPGGIHGPVVEAVAGLLALGVDRLTAALPGRAWSMEDPVVPVTDEGDLRQRVLLLVAARRGRPVRTWLQPFDVRDDRVDWHDRALDGDGGCEGWVPQALAVAADADWSSDPAAAAEQLARCTRLGHTVMLTPAGSELLGEAQLPGR